MYTQYERPGCALGGAHQESKWFEVFVEMFLEEKNGVEKYSGEK